MEAPASIAANLERVTAAISAAEIKYGCKAGSVKLLAASKAQPVDAVTAALAAGQIAFGENYVQEAQRKIERIGNRGIEWHFIGPIQSNKVGRIAAFFAWVHSVDRASLARRLSQQRPTEAAVLNVCIQVNISGEKTKSGIEPANIKELLDSSADLPGLKVRGLMAIPAPATDFAAQRCIFAKVKRIFDAHSGSYALDTLSMGMSGDFVAAIAEGATMIRLGTAIFGTRES